MNGDKHYNRRFSLDSLGYSPDSGGSLLKAKGCKMRRSIDGTKSRGLDEAHLEPLDINRSLHRTSPTKNSTIEEEGGRIDGLSRNSFKNHKKTFHKHFPEIAELEELTSAFTCAIHKEVLYHGKMYISEQHVCFYSSVLLKDTKVVIPASTIQVIKKKNTARVVPNAISIITSSGEKHLFVSIRNRDVCYKLLQLICPHLQAGSANGSPQMSSAENVHDLEVDTISSPSSQEDNGELRRVSLPDRLPLSSFSVSNIPDGQAKQENSSSPPHDSTCRTEDESTEEKDTATVSWVTMVTEKIRSALSTRTTSQLNKLLIIYLLLVLLLLFTSGYIGLRIVALEEQLNTLGALPEFSHNTEYKET